MTPTHAKSNNKRGKFSGAGGKARRSKLNLVDDTAVKKDSASDALPREAPLNQQPQGEAAAVAKVRASDLLIELREISAQVNRMMSQVDRAIHRLGVHAGEPLRR